MYQHFFLFNLPVFFIPYLFSARYYLQPFWVPLAALVCLFAPSVRVKKTGEPKYPASRYMKLILAPVLCVLLIVNASTSYNFLSNQYATSTDSRAKIADIKAQLAAGGKVMNATTIARGLFYGLFFNLRDEGIAYHYSETLPDADSDLYYYMLYNIRDSGPDPDAEANAFLYSLFRDGYLVVIAARGGGSLTEPMTASLQRSGLMPAGPADTAAGYLAVIDPESNVVYEQAGYSEYRADIGGVALAAQSAETGLSVTIDGTEYAYSPNGFNVVVYDTVNRTPVYSAVINTDGNPVMTMFPVRVTVGSAP